MTEERSFAARPTQKFPAVALTSGIQISSDSLDGDVGILVKQLVDGDEVLILAYTYICNDIEGQ